MNIVTFPQPKTAAQRLQAIASANGQRLGYKKIRHLPRRPANDNPNDFDPPPRAA